MFFDIVKNGNDPHNWLKFVYNVTSTDGGSMASARARRTSTDAARDVHAQAEDLAGTKRGAAATIAGAGRPVQQHAALRLQYPISSCPSISPSTPRTP